MRSYAVGKVWLCDGLYVHSRFNLYKHATLYREDFANVLPELYVAVADPELSAGRRVHGSPSSSNNQSVVDYEKLCKFTIVYVLGTIQLNG